MNIPSTVVIIPTINELLGLKTILPQLSKLKHDILIVDDVSTDGSRHFIKQYKKRLADRFDYIFRSTSDGFRAAYFAGFKNALEGNYQYIVMMDGDGAHNPSYIPKMLNHLNEGFDLVIGSRYIEGGDIQSFPLWRKATSYCSNWLIRKFVSNQVRDWSSGFIAIRADLLKKILDQQYATGFSFLVQMKKYAIDNRAKIKEIPIHFVNCENTKSKFSFKIAWEALLVFFRIVLDKKSLW